MNFIDVSEEELARLRPDPLLVEQELDFRPEVAEAVEKAVGFRAGQVFWRSSHDHLYSLELGDLGRERPSTATVFGHWDRYEPRPPEHEIDADLLDVSAWVAEIADDLDPANVMKVAGFAGAPGGWAEGSVLRTPDERFANLPGFDYEPKYVEIEGQRVAYVEAGEGDPILMLHGEPTWGYLYRKMIPPLRGAGRVVVPDLVGFGRSDKPTAVNAYSYRSHVRWLRKFIEALDLGNITLICQDWGGLLGLRVLADHPERFKRLVAMNTGLSIGVADAKKRVAFSSWRRFSQKVRAMDVPRMMRKTLVDGESFSDEELAAYQAPFPSPEYQTAALVFPRLVPNHPLAPGAYENKLAIEALGKLKLPVLLPWGGQDPITAPSRPALMKTFPHAVAPEPLQNAGHFIQEDAGEELARELIRPWLVS